MCSVLESLRQLEDITEQIICLALSGLFDMFDGKIARTKRTGTDDEKLFGVQIDSLLRCSLFWCVPGSNLLNVLGVRGILGTIVLAYYCVCSVIRLWDSSMCWKPTARG